MKIKNLNKQQRQTLLWKVLLWLNELRLKQEAFRGIPLAVTYLVVTS